MNRSNLARWRLACAALSLSLLAAQASAQSEPFSVRCKQWIEKKGYAADYIESRTGLRQPGQPPAWKGNVPLADVKPGDVVFSSVPGSTTAQSVAYVEEVETGPDGAVSAVYVTQWNQGRQFIDRDCLVTTSFGLPGAKTRVPLISLLRAWRPSLPLQ
jgi:hypothetical protein